MKVFQSLTIRGSRAALQEFLLEVERRLTDGWTEDRSLEDSYTSGRRGGPGQRP